MASIATVTSRGAVDTLMIFYTLELKIRCQKHLHYFSALGYSSTASTISIDMRGFTTTTTTAGNDIGRLAVRTTGA